MLYEVYAVGSSKIAQFDEYLAFVKIFHLVIEFKPFLSTFNTLMLCRTFPAGGHFSIILRTLFGIEVNSFGFILESLFSSVFPQCSA